MPEQNTSIYIQYHFIREAIQEYEIKLQYCPTEEIVADIFTKPLSKLRKTSWSNGNEEDLVDTEI